MVLSWKFLAKRMAGGFPLKRFMPLMPVGLPLDHAHPEPSHRQALLPPRPSNLTGVGSRRISDHTFGEPLHFRTILERDTHVVDRSCRFQSLDQERISQGL